MKNGRSGVLPEFWDDAAKLSCDSQVLFVAAFDAADGEGLLNWTPGALSLPPDHAGLAQPYVLKCLASEMRAAGLLLPYWGGRSRQRFAWVINFPRYQDVRTVARSLIPPPSIQSADVLESYTRRDGFMCHLCGHPVMDPGDHRHGPLTVRTTRLCASLDHVTPRVRGGTDYPSNIRLSHQTCNKARGDRPVGVSPSWYAPTGRAVR